LVDILKKEGDKKIFAEKICSLGLERDGMSKNLRYLLWFSTRSSLRCFYLYLVIVFIAYLTPEDLIQEVFGQQGQEELNGFLNSLEDVLLPRKREGVIGCRHLFLKLIFLYLDKSRAKLVFAVFKLGNFTSKRRVMS